MQNALSVRTPDWNGYGVTNDDKPEKPKRGPVMNALSQAFKFGAPEAYEQGRQRKLKGQLGEALKSEDYGNASNLLIDMGQYDAGMKMRDAQQSRAGEASTQKAQQLMSLTENLMQIPEDRRGQYLMENWQQFEPIVGTDFMTHWQKTGGDVSDASLGEDLAALRTQLGVGAPEGPEAYTLAPGARRYEGDQMVAENPKQVTPGFKTVTTDAGIFQYDPANPQETMQLLGQPPEKTGQPNLSVNFGEGGSLEGITFGSAPKGKDAAIVRGTDGPVVTPGPQQALYNKTKNAMGDYKVTNDLVLQDIDRAVEMAGSTSTGLMGAVTQRIPGTEGYDLSKVLDSVKANIGFDKLQEMRDNSPTGGALGQVSEWELQLLQSVLGSLEQAQTKDQFIYNMSRIKQIKIEGAARREEAFKQDFPSLGETAEFRNEAKSSIDDLVSKYAGGS